MSQDLNASDIDGESIVNLALETFVIVADSKFQNIDLVTRAIAYLIEAVEIEPGNYKIHFCLGILLLAGKLYEESIKFLLNAADMNPSSEIEKYITFAEQEMDNQKREKVNTVSTKKKTTVDDLLDLGNKFKF